MPALQVLTLLFVGGFYGVFLGLQGAPSLDAHLTNLAGAFEIPPQDFRSGLELLAKSSPSGPMVVHTLAIVAHLEILLWLAIGGAAFPAILFPSLRPGVYLVGGLALTLAAMHHARNMGLLGPVPWHAASSDFNMVLLIADSVAALMCFASLLTLPSAKLKAA